MYKANPASVPRSERIVRRATCGPSDAVGKCVVVSAARNGNLWRVAGVTSATLTAETPAVGVIVKKLSPTVCFVQFHGTTPFTVYSSLIPGRVYVVGTDGFPAAAGDPAYPPVSDIAQPIGIATSNDELLVQPLSGVTGSGGGSRLFDQPLTGTQDGVNEAYTTELPFVAVGPSAQSVYRNGVRQRVGAGNDYTVSESMGPGTGYDMITFNSPPLPLEYLTIDFVPA